MALNIDAEFACQVQDALDKAAQHAPKRCREFVSADMLARVIRAASKYLQLESTLVQVRTVVHVLRCRNGCIVWDARHHTVTWQVSPRHNDVVYIVGDVHGQYHDVQHILKTLPKPGDGVVYVFNGDYVDRGSRSAEVLMQLCTWKAAWPDHVYMLRGNHETRWCNKSYGFHDELRLKFGASGSRV